jgi:ABC-type protease/lipase transport system fused ATPase/permease subunit
VLHSLPLDEKRAFLQFATGCDRAPVAGLKALRLVVQVCVCGVGAWVWLEGGQGGGSVALLICKAQHLLSLRQVISRAGLKALRLVVHRLLVCLKSGGRVSVGSGGVLSC